jgi:IS5 family transposase
MEQVVPWGELCALVGPYYPKPGKGRPAVGVERMLRIYFLQQWFNLSDPGVEEALYDSAVMRQFVGIDLGCEPVPDETAVWTKVEHVFAVMKLKFGFVKLRYRGLKKNVTQLFTVCPLVNLYLARKKLLLLAPA